MEEVKVTIVVRTPVVWTKHSLDKMGKYGKFYAYFDVDAAVGRQLADGIRAGVEEAKRPLNILARNPSRTPVVNGSLEDLETRGGTVSASSTSAPKIFDERGKLLNKYEVAQIPQNAFGCFSVTPIIYSHGDQVGVCLELKQLQYLGSPPADDSDEECPFPIVDSGAGAQDFLC